MTLNHFFPILSGRQKIYLVIFYISFQILALQIVLSLLLEVLTFLPFLAISFAFLGLNAAGVYLYVRYSNRPAVDTANFLPNILLSYGMLLLLNIGVTRNLELIDNFIFKFFPPTNTEYEIMLFKTLANSLIVGIVFALTFFVLGLLIALIYKSYSDTAPKLYLSDLLGAACGCILGVSLLNLIQINSILILLALLAFIGAYGSSPRDESFRARRIFTIFLIVISLSAFLFIQKTGLFEIKLDTHLLAGDAKKQEQCEEIYVGWNSYSRIALIKHKLPEEKQYNYNFAINSAVGRALLIPFDPQDPYRFKLFEGFTPPALGFLLNTPKDMLILFAGAGRDMLEAYSYSQGSTDITGVEINPLIVRKAASFPGFYLQDFFQKKNVHMVVHEGRSYLEKTKKSYDAIVLSWAGASFAHYLGIAGYTGQYLFTKEAFMSYLNHLNPDGVIGIVNSNKIRLLAMAKAALEELGYDEPEKKIILMESLDSLAKGEAAKDMLSPLEGKFLLVKKGNFTEEEIARIEKNIAKMNMTWIYNPYYTRPGFEIYRDLLQAKNITRWTEELSLAKRQNLSIPTDDKPFIQNNFLYLSLFSNEFWQLFSAKYRATRPIYYALHPFMIAFLSFVILIGFLLLIFPLWRVKQAALSANDLKILYFFAALGLGFIFVEISIMHHFTFLLGNPIYAFSFVLSSLLLSTGMGSLLSNRLYIPGRLNLEKSAGLATVLLLIYFFWLPLIIKFSLPMSSVGRFFITFVSILPLGICLGMLFPQGLRQLHSRRGNLIPWAWAFNGYLSLVGSMLSYYLAMQFGFSSFLLMAACLYLSIVLLRIKF